MLQSWVTRVTLGDTTALAMGLEIAVAASIELDAPALLRVRAAVVLTGASRRGFNRFLVATAWIFAPRSSGRQGRQAIR